VNVKLHADLDFLDSLKKKRIPSAETKLKQFVHFKPRLHDMFNSDSVKDVSMGHHGCGFRLNNGRGVQRSGNWVKQ